jgi:hypothetical protein
LHVPFPKVPQIAPLPRTAAIGLGQGKLSQRHTAARDLLLIALEDLARFFLAAGDFGLQKY